MENDSPVTVKPSKALPQAKPFSPRPSDETNPHEVKPHEAKPYETKPAMSAFDVAERDAEALHVAADSNDKAGVFQRLVKEDTDITGLVAYSIYKQNKLDWLRAFEKAKGRAPNEGELASYIIGEGTPRRLATYRHLAEATLAGNGPDIEGVETRGGPLVKHFSVSQRKALTTSVIASYALIAVLFVILFWVAARFTMSSH